MMTKDSFHITLYALYEVFKSLIGILEMLTCPTDKTAVPLNVNEEEHMAPVGPV